MGFVGVFLFGLLFLFGFFYPKKVIDGVQAYPI